MKAEGEADSGCGGDKDLRVLILTPQGRDAALAEKTLARSGLFTHVCKSIEELRQELAAGAGSVLIAEEALPHGDVGNAWLGAEPPWSSLPLIVLLARGNLAHNFGLLRSLELRPNVSFLERPVPKRTLITALRAAVEARRLQYAVRDALEALQIANRKKDEFLATLAHELRNPLAPIRNAIYAFPRLRDDDPRGRDQKGSLISMMERQVDHLVRLVDDLLEISRIRTGKIVLKTRRVDLAETIRHAIEISEPLMRAQRHELNISLDDQPLTVEGDPVRLTQIFANLLNNAAKYTPPGGRVWISSERQGRRAIVRVNDNGVGIEDGAFGEVFELFWQSNRAMGHAQGGLGIGLALVRNLVEMHGGEVEARSGGAGQGSEFIVRLPLVAGRGETAEVRPAAFAAPAPHRVLVVDDEKAVADSFALLLQTLGAEVCIARSGAEALSAIAMFNPKVAFVDIGMPEMDGYEAARRIRLAPEGKDLVLVALSGWGREEDRRRALEAGFNAHFVKPISLDALEGLLALEASGK